jgi:hypothetical protein
VAWIVASGRGYYERAQRYAVAVRRVQQFAITPTELAGDARRTVACVPAEDSTVLIGLWRLIAGSYSGEEQELRIRGIELRFLLEENVPEHVPFTATCFSSNPIAVCPLRTAGYDIADMEFTFVASRAYRLEPQSFAEA